MKTMAFVTIAVWACGIQPAVAQDETAPPEGVFDISGSASVTSDYMFRGISLSGNDPAVQASLEAQHRSGFYVGVWGSSIAKYAGTNVETDLYAGWRGEAAGVELDLGAQAYLYPGGKGGNYVELIGSAGKTLGPVQAEAGVAYAPAQNNIGSQDNLYVFGTLSSGIPGTPLTLTLDGGYEDGSLAGPKGRKWDWGVTLDYVRGPFSVSVSYKDSDVARLLDPGKLARGRVVGTVTVTF
jgi:uncharacterized protein (TIGR02001 family)